MAGEEYEFRTFPGDPNPPATPPEPRGTAAVADAPAESGGGAAPPPAASSAPTNPAPNLFTVETDEEGNRSVFVTDDSFQTTRLGPVSLQGDEAQGLLGALGRFNPITKSWSVDEGVARQLMSGEMPLPDYLPAKYRAQKAMIARGAIGADWLRGALGDEQADALGNLESLKMQVKEAPAFVWRGSVLNTVADVWKNLGGAGGVAKRAAGEAAAQAAFYSDPAMATAAAAGIVASVAAAPTAPVAAAAAVPLLKFMATAPVFAQSFRIEAGNAALDMKEKGVDLATARKFAVPVGVVNGFIEAATFHALPKNLQRLVTSKLLAVPAVKNALAAAVVNYGKEVGQEFTQESAQSILTSIGENMALESAGMPEKKTGAGEVVAQAASEGLAAAMGAGLIKAPLAVAEVRGARADTAAEAKAAEAVDAKLKERAAAKVAPVEETAPAAEATPAAEEATPSSAAENLDALVQELDKGTTTPEEFIADVTKVTEEAHPPFEAKTREVESKARVKKLESDLSDVETLIDLQTKAREQLQKGGQSTRRIDALLTDLLAEEERVKQDLTFYAAAGKQALVTPEETLEMKPATLESVAKTGFEQGRADVLKVRRRQVLDVAEKLELTQGELSKILGARNYGTMSDAEFNHWVAGTLKPQAKEALRRRLARQDVAELEAEKELTHTARIRQLNDLPGVGKMTTEQLRQYAEILEEYDRGDVPLTPSLIKANETTPFRGAKTFREVLQIAMKMGQPLDDLRAAGATSELDIFTPLPHVAPKNPHYAFAIGQVDAAKAKFGAEYTAFRTALHRLATPALASRARGIGRVLSPTMKEVFAYLEDPSPEKQAALTEEEMQLAQFIRAFYDVAYDYLVAVEGLESRFAGGKYAFHTQKDVGEILRDLPDKGLKATAKALADLWRDNRVQVTVTDGKGNIVGRRKFFKQTLFREGGLDPSQNVIKAVDSYAKQFFTKQALDQAIPFIETSVKAAQLEADFSEDEAVKQNAQATAAWVADFLRAQKGQSILEKVIPQGGKVDAAIRLLSSYISLMYIAGNIKLQMLSAVGETMALLPAIRVKGLGVGNYRAFSAQGKKILAKYEHFTGPTILKQLREPGRSFDDQLGALMYGIIQSNRHHALQVALLASMTQEEFDAGAISDERLAQVKLKLGRWVDLPGNKSVFGSTSTGSAATKFRGWAIPVVWSLGGYFERVGNTLRGRPNTPLTSEQVSELFGMVEAAMVATAVTYLVLPKDREDWTAVDKKLFQEIWTMVSALSPSLLLTPGLLAAFLVKFGNALSLLGTKYKSGEREGEDRGVAELMKLGPWNAAFFRNFKDSKEKE